MINIYTIPHTLFAARHLAAQLCHLGHPARIVTDIDPRSPHLHIIYGAAMCSVFPRNYIVYQTEVAGSHFFNVNYVRILSRARAVWDYHPDNVSAYAHANPRHCIVTPGYELQPHSVKDVPVLFYGWVEGSPRRLNIIKQLRRHMPLHVITNLLAPHIWDRLSRAHTVINLHYHPHSPLERFRINEALSHHCHVISEEPADPRYTGLVHFADTAEEIVSAWQCLSKQPFHHDLAPLSNKKEILHGLSLAGHIG